MSTHNLWGRFHGTEAGRSLAEAVRFAIDRCARGMLDDGDALEEGSMATPPDVRVCRGVEAIRAAARDIPGWAAREDAQWIASYNARCIEKFGNGGGNFRRLYAGFLDWARGLDAALVPAEAPGLCTRAADGWTATSDALRWGLRSPTARCAPGFARLARLRSRLPTRDSSAHQASPGAH
jgi:hypothetical protein